MANVVFSVIVWDIETRVATRESRSGRFSALAGVCLIEKFSSGRCEPSTTDRHPQT